MYSVSVVGEKRILRRIYAIRVANLTGEGRGEVMESRFVLSPEMCLKTMTLL